MDSESALPANPRAALNRETAFAKEAGRPRHRFAPMLGAVGCDQMVVSSVINLSVLIRIWQCPNFDSGPIFASWHT